MKDDLKILFLEDNPDDALLIQRTLKRSMSFNASYASNRDEFVTQLFSFEPDIVLSDHSLPQFDSLSALEIVKENAPSTPFILVTGSVSEEFAVTCIKSGAENYVLKDNLMRLPSIIENALNKKDLKSENTVVKSLNQKLENLYKIIAQKNKDIIDSITYSQRIQQAILPKPEKLNDILPKSFILYKPKDIISGDFFWFSEQYGTVMLVVSDCTGHGVPGALLSMAGCGFVKISIFLKEKHNAADILNDLNHTFCDVFGIAEENDSPIHDGMDISVCSFNKAQRTIDFSAARRPMYLLRNGEVQEFKSSMHAIGYSYLQREPYVNLHLKLEKGDRVYMCTDGFADQFGGVDGKKFKSSTLKSMLVEMKDIPIVEQKDRLEMEFNKWKDKDPQTDDVLIMGFEVE
jgi:serine phosphatase RsbU (regulator of sigma subunit)